MFSLRRLPLFGLGNRPQRIRLVLAETKRQQFFEDFASLMSAARIAERLAQVAVEMIAVIHRRALPWHQIERSGLTTADTFLRDVLQSSPSASPSTALRRVPARDLDGRRQRVLISFAIVRADYAMIEQRSGGQLDLRSSSCACVVVVTS